jgi:hypothetical protein
MTGVFNANSALQFHRDNRWRRQPAADVSRLCANDRLALLLRMKWAWMSRQLL